MYINPFAAGVLTTIFVELAVVFLFALIKTGGRK
jgi:hypothetical protein